ncbi:MAG: PD-(D/E)XK nuclease family protein [Lachnospiraceae bacterium]|nr:PD-(D/E)XK nuclease family protein [Lachnospiraceae bacterium]
MALQFWFGASGSGKSTEVQKEMIRQACEHPERNYFMIVPDQFTMQTQKKIVKMHPDGGILNIDVLSFGRLSHRIFEEVGRDDRLLLDDTGKCLLLRKVAEQEKSNIPVLATGLKHSGYIQEVKSIISEFMQYGLRPEDVKALAQFAESKRPLSLKLNDLSVIYQAFIKECESRFLTKEEMLDVLKERLSLSDIVKKSTFIFDGFTGFTPIQNRVIEELMLLAEDVIVTLEMDHRYSPYRIWGEDFLFHLSTQTVASLQKIAQDNKVILKEDVILSDVPVQRFKTNPEMSHLERNLFRNNCEKYEGNNNVIELIKAGNRRDECAVMCATMFQFIEQKGYRYRDIAVVTGDMNRYEALLRQQFDKYGVPYFMDTTKSLMNNPFVAFLRNAIAVLRQGFRYNEVFRFLRTGLTDLTREEIDMLENYVRARGIRGYSAWNQPFTRSHKEGLRDEKQAEELNSIREKFAGIFGTLWNETAGGRLSATKWCELLYGFCVEQNIEYKLETYASAFEANNELSTAIEYRQIYRLIMDLLNQIAGLLGEDELTLGEFSDILDAGFEEIRVRSIPQGVDLLVVGDIERTRLNDIKVLFFLGVNDGNIPQSSSKGGLISDLEREFLINSGKELAPTPASQMFIEHLYLYMNLTKPSEYLYLSYSVMEDDGSSLRPAYLIAELQKIFPALEVQRRNPYSRILSQADARERMAALLSEYATGTMTEEQLKELYGLYADLSGRDDSREWLHEITEAAFMQYRPTDLERKLAEELYGKMMECSISSLERFASCHYAHFLAYGLRLEEREEYGFESMDMGNVMHEILQMFGKMLEKEKLDWLTVDAENIEHFLDNAIEEISQSYGGAILSEGGKNRYYKEQLKRIVKRTIRTLQEQLRHGSFRPYAFEKEFRHIYDFSNEDHKAGQLLLKGRIDRIDTCEQDDELFVKVVDYKAGIHKFDINTLYYGVALQLAVYLGQTVKNLQTTYPDKKITPAAMLYYRTADPLLATDKVLSAEDSERAILKELNNTGAVAARAGIVEALDAGLEGKSVVVPVTKKGEEIKLSDSVYNPVLLNTILDYAQEKTIALAEEIINGKIDINPQIIGDRDACAYCAYKGACGFDRKIKGYEKIKPEEITVEEFERRRQNGSELHSGSAEGH